MKHFFLFFLICQTVYSFAQNVSLNIMADKQPAIGASIFVNGVFKTIADENGKVLFKNIRNNDTIKVTYLGYKPDIIIYNSQNKEIEVNLIQENYKLSEVTITPSNDKVLFKNMLKWGLEEMTITKAIPFCLTDTLLFIPDTIIYRRITGTFVMPIRGNRATVDQLQVEILEETPIAFKKNYLSRYGNKKENNVFENYKIPSREIGLCFFEAYCLSIIDRDINYVYMGKDSANFDIFDFSMPNTSWMISDYSKGKVYFGGRVYLNNEGIIETIKDYKTSFSAIPESYEYDINYIYERKSNKIIPYKAEIKTYRLDKDLNVVVSRSAHLEIYSKQAIETGVLIHN